MTGGFLYQEPKTQLFIILYSFLLGVGIGVVYSLFDTIYIMFCPYIVSKESFDGKIQEGLKNKIKISKIFQFSIDFFFSVVYTVITVIFIFCANKGRFRFFMLAFAAVGFVFYKLTVGRIVSFCMRALFKYIHRILKKIFILPLCRLLKTVKTCFDGYVIKKRFLNTVVKDKEF